MHGSQKDDGKFMELSHTISNYNLLYLNLNIIVTYIGVLLMSFNSRQLIYSVRLVFTLVKIDSNMFT